MYLPMSSAIRENKMLFEKKIRKIAREEAIRVADEITIGLIKTAQLAEAIKKHEAKKTTKKVAKKTTTKKEK